MAEEPYTPPELREDALGRAILVGVDRGGSRDGWSIDESLEELARLAETAGIRIVGKVTQRMDKPNPRTFTGAGKAEEIARLAESLRATQIVFDEDLTPSQQYNLEGLIPQVKLVDRTALILEIFAMHATSREGKLQVELAQLQYLLPRLRGMWGHLERERLGGGRGARFGAGESQLETDRRLARKRIGELKRDLAQVARARRTQRAARAASGVFRVSLVGYTNAGKSSLLNALTGAGALEADMLFATLDSTTRRMELPEGRLVTLSDTVGFINKLPHGLVEAFKSTLDEVREADLLLHVVDTAHPQRREQVRAVSEVLGEIGAAATRQVTVFNKIDVADTEALSRLRARRPDAVFVSALTGQGLDALAGRVSTEAARDSRTMSLVVPYTRGDIVDAAHARAQVVSERHTEHGTEMVVKAPAALSERFAEFETGGEGGGAGPDGTE
ncbi:MAG: GTPase HflX [Coriobacteriia bacterium]|nr:GTPase HflX [Coriobacteriia bacterium]